MPVPRQHSTNHASERAFVRHPARVPIHVASVSSGEAMQADDVSYGGLSFTCREHHRPGAAIEIRIPDVGAGFHARARVVWCRSTQSGYRVGVRFLDPDDAFRSRMVEQLCAIEAYRRQVRETEGRELNGEQAAAEWIARYADAFPNP